MVAGGVAFVFRPTWARVTRCTLLCVLSKLQSLSEPQLAHLGRDHAPGVDVGVT